jgi:hypothetical protein
VGPCTCSRKQSSPDTGCLRAELLADTRGFGPESGEIAVWLPLAVLEPGKADVLRRLAELPQEWLEEIERTADRGSAPTLPATDQVLRGG